MNSPNITVRGCTCRMAVRRYQETGDLAIQFFDALNGEPVVRASVNPPRPLHWMQLSHGSVDPATWALIRRDPTVIPAGYVAIKDVDENTGILGDLEQAGVVQDTGVRIGCGRTVAVLCRYTGPPAS